MIKKEKRFFRFGHYVYYTMIKREKRFFSFSHYVHYTMIKRERKGFLHLVRTFSTL